MAGRGPSVVLVHGSWTDHHTWLLVLPELNDSFRVVTYELVGQFGPVTERFDDLRDLPEGSW